MVRTFAEQRLHNEDSATARHAAVDRLLRAYAYVAAEAAVIHSPEAAGRFDPVPRPDLHPPVPTSWDEAVGWLDLECENLLALALHFDDADLGWFARRSR